MFGYIKKDSIKDHIKMAEKRASKKTAKEYQAKIRKKNDEIRKLKQYIRRVRKGYDIYREQRDGYRNMSEHMQDRLFDFQNNVNRAIGLLRGDFDDINYQVYLDSLKDKKVLKLIK